MSESREVIGESHYIAILNDTAMRAASKALRLGQYMYAIPIETIEEHTKAELLIKIAIDSRVTEQDVRDAILNLYAKIHNRDEK